MEGYPYTWLMLLLPLLPRGAAGAAAAGIHVLLELAAGVCQCLLCSVRL